MKLKYRGVAYESNPTHVTTVEGKVGGKYRGVPWQAKVPQIISVDEPSVDLKYRGVPYRHGAVKVIDRETVADKTAVTHPEMLSVENSGGETKPVKLKVKG